MEAQRTPPHPSSGFFLSVKGFSPLLWGRRRPALRNSALLRFHTCLCSQDTSINGCVNKPRKAANHVASLAQTFCFWIRGWRRQRAEAVTSSSAQEKISTRPIAFSLADCWRRWLKRDCQKKRGKDSCKPPTLHEGKQSLCQGETRRFSDAQDGGSAGTWET